MCGYVYISELSLSFGVIYPVEPAFKTVHCLSLSSGIIYPVDPAFKTVLCLSLSSGGNLSCGPSL